MKPGSFLSGGTFALVALFGSGLLAIAAAWLLEKSGRPIPKLLQAPLLWILAYVIFGKLLQPPLPFSIFATYMGIVTIAILLYSAITTKSWQEFIGPIRRFLEDDPPIWQARRIVTLMLLPAIVAYATFNFMAPKERDIIDIEGLRLVHEAPPIKIDVGGKLVPVYGARNPFQVDDRGAYSITVQRENAKGNPWGDHPSPYMTYVREGGEIYFQNCFFCHGANLDGSAIFASVFNPTPSNLRSIARVINPYEGDTFWRVSTGGQARDRSVWPWASSMPAGREFLSPDEIWKVILFEYWEAGYAPWVYDEQFGPRNID